MAEQSKASVLRSCKRKVVGSNPSDASFDHCFSYGDWVDCKKETDSQRTGTPTITTINNDNNHQTTTITKRKKASFKSSASRGGAILH